ncbi:MAG: type II toxin-antitoxin system VapC family toxin [Lachnospiraceae bacterium]|nr:type II toxin-antitoxin system VapC family toxin [Lachnospiraceae bacterium]
MNIVLDCSGAFEIILQKEKAHLYAELLRNADWVAAPDLYKIECMSALCDYTSTGEISKEEALGKQDELFGLIDEFTDPSENITEAFSEAVRLRQNVRSMMYFTLARRLGAVLLTSDHSLASLAEKEGVTVR